MKKIVLLIIMAMILASCADRNVSVSISGDTLIIAAYEVYHHTRIDSLKIIKGS